MFRFQPGKQSQSYYILPILHIIIVFKCLISVFSVSYLPCDITSVVYLRGFCFSEFLGFFQRSC